MRGEKFMAFALSALIALAPLSACSQQGAGEGAADEEEMSRNAELTGEIIYVDANEQGAYTVTITEHNLMLDEALAEKIPDIVTAEEAGIEVEEEMTRDEVESVVTEEGADADTKGADAAATEPEAGVAAADAETTEPEAAAEATKPEEGTTEPEAAAEAAKPEEGTTEPEAAAEAAEPEEGAAEATKPEANDTAKAEPAEWSLTSVAKEDVSVSYNVAVVPDNESAEVTYETRKANVTGFSNDAGTIELSFQGEAPEGEDLPFYTVRFAGTEAYAVVQVVPEDNGVVIEDVDFDAQLAELNAYKPDFSEADISLPEGTSIEDGELVVADDAPEVVQDALLDSGYAESEMSRVEGDDDKPSFFEAFMGSDEQDFDGDTAIFRYNGVWYDNDMNVHAGPDGADANNGNAAAGDGAVNDVAGAGDADAGAADDNNAGAAAGAASGGDSAAVEYMQRYNARQLRYKNYDAVAYYVPQILSQIDPKAGEVAEMGANAYRIFRGFYTNDWGSGIQGTLGVLKAFGLFKGPGGTGISNAQLLSEIQKVGIEVSEMHALTKAMNATLNETLKQAYRNNLQTFDNAVLSLHSNAEIVQSMIVEGAIRAEEDGIAPPAEDCEAEDEFDYNYELIHYIKELEKKGGRKNSAFEGFAAYVKAMEDDFMLVAGEVSKQEDTNPIKSYDKYWDLHFNFDTQGYYLRQSYRSDIEYELKRAYGIMEIYHNIFDPYTKSTFKEYNNKFCAALDGLEALDAGVSPEEVCDSSLYPYKHYKNNVHCNTFNRDIGSVYRDWRLVGYNVPVDLLDEYVERLHGRSPWEDMLLAGMVKDVNDPSTLITFDILAYPNNSESYERCAHGIGFNGKETSSTFKADVIVYSDGQLHKGMTLWNDGKNLKFPDDSNNKHWSFPVLYFEFV